MTSSGNGCSKQHTVRIVDTVTVICKESQKASKLPAPKNSIQGLDSCILSTPSHLANVELGEGLVSAFETTLDHQCSSTTSHKFAVVISINNG